MIKPVLIYRCGVALENEITPIYVCSVEWSDCSVFVQKYTFGSLSLLKRDTVRGSARWSVHTQSIDKIFQCMPFDKFSSAVALSISVFQSVW